MFDLQSVIAIVVIGGAVLYAASMFLRKSKAFTVKNTCGDDCGCSSSSKTPRAVH